MNFLGSAGDFPDINRPERFTADRWPILGAAIQSVRSSVAADPFLREVAPRNPFLSHPETGTGRLQDCPIQRAAGYRRSGPGGYCVSRGHGTALCARPTLFPRYYGGWGP